MNEERSLATTGQEEQKGQGLSYYPETCPVQFCLSPACPPTASPLSLLPRHLSSPAQPGSGSSHSLEGDPTHGLILPDIV